MKTITYISALFLAAFGLLTLFLSASIIFDLFGVRAKEGNYVLFVVWANFISSFIYLFASYGLIKKQKWTATILGIATLILILTFARFINYINSDGIHETKTIGAMIFRISISLFFALFAYFTISRKSKTLKTN